MITMSETKPSVEPIPLSGGDPEFRETYRDWQAIRIIRDNYFDGWRLFYTFYFWFGATMVGVAGYIILNRPFQKHDAYVTGFIGLFMILNVLVFAIALFFHSRRHVKNIRLILEREGDTSYLAEKVLSARGALMMSAGASFGLSAGLAAWVYIFFFYYMKGI